MRAALSSSDQSNPGRACAACPFHSLRIFSIVGTLYEYTTHYAYLTFYVFLCPDLIEILPYSFYLVFSYLVYKIPLFIEHLSLLYLHDN